MTIRWGLIGAGDIVRKRVAAALRDTEGSELVAVSRRDASQAEAAATEFGARLAFADWRELVASAEIDAVYVATPVDLHAEQTIAAAEAGKHVLCEKPMALDAIECDRMIAACQANDVKLGVAYYRHFYPLIDRIKQVIASGEIGKVSLVQINAFEPFDPAPDHPRRWLLNPEKSGGGPMMDFGCHRLEVLIHLFGDVKAISSSLSAAVYHRDVEDTAVATLQFTSDVMATVSVTHATFAAFDTFDVFGTDGAIFVASLNGARLSVSSHGSSRDEDVARNDNTHEPLVADFVQAIAHDREPVVGGHAGREVSRLVDEIYSDGQCHQMGGS